MYSHFFLVKVISNSKTFEKSRLGTSNFTGFQALYKRRIFLVKLSSNETCKQPKLSSRMNSKSLIRFGNSFVTIVRMYEPTCLSKALEGFVGLALLTFVDLTSTLQDSSWMNACLSSKYLAQIFGPFSLLCFCTEDFAERSRHLSLPPMGYNSTGKK